MVPSASACGGEDDAGEVFEVDLVADAHAGGDGGEVVEGGLAPLEEGVALAVALELERGVGVVGVGGAELVDLDGVVDDELGGLEGVDFVGVAAEGAHGVAHGGEVDDGGNAGEVLHEDAGGHVGDLEESGCMVFSCGAGCAGLRRAGYLPHPVKVCKVFRTFKLGLDFGYGVTWNREMRGRRDGALRRHCLSSVNQSAEAFREATWSGGRGPGGRGGSA